VLGGVLVELQEHVGVLDDLGDRLGVFGTVVDLERFDGDLGFIDVLGVVAVWLKEAAAIGTEPIIQKMAHAVELSVLGGGADVDWALGHAAVHGRFATGDLDSILAANGLERFRI
jgi:hypothetical protein